MNHYNLNITASAKKHFMELIGQEKNNVIRIGLKQIGCSGWQFIVNVDKKNDEDVCWTDGALEIVFDVGLAKRIDGTNIDYVQKELGQKKLKIDCPTAVMHCGCGESFSFENDDRGVDS